jgi:hypothetical protein
MSDQSDPADFSFVVKRRGNPPKPWRWEIYRAGTNDPVERSAVFFESTAEALKEGKKALVHCWRTRWRDTGGLHTLTVVGQVLMAQLAMPIRREPGGPGCSHSASFDHRRRPKTLRTAMATAFFCPTRTTSRLPRVTPV